MDANPPAVKADEVALFTFLVKGDTMCRGNFICSFNKKRVTFRKQNLTAVLNPLSYFYFFNKVAEYKMSKL